MKESNNNPFEPQYKPQFNPFVKITREPCKPNTREFFYYEPKEMDKKEPEEDMVNHPRHYNMYKVEVIETILDWIQYIDNPQVAYLVGTALKYIPRSPLKHDSPTEDLKKAVFYLNKAIDVIELSEQDLDEKLGRGN